MTADLKKTVRILSAALLAAYICCNIIVYFIPTIAITTGGEGLTEYVGHMGRFWNALLHPGEDDIVLAGWVGSLIAWAWFWFESGDNLVHALFLIVAGICTAKTPKEGRKILDQVQQDRPFAPENAHSFRRVGRLSLVIAGAALVRALWELSRGALALDDALLIFVFLAGALLCWVLSALFGQAAQLKAENDLTI